MANFNNPMDRYIYEKYGPQPERLTITQCILGLTPKDYLTLGGITTAGYTYGYFTAKPKIMRPTGGMTGAIMAGACATILLLSRSSKRITEQYNKQNPGWNTPKDVPNWVDTENGPGAAYKTKV